jgi:hypothetical protein
LEDTLLGAGEIKLSRPETAPEYEIVVNDVMEKINRIIPLFLFHKFRNGFYENEMRICQWDISMMTFIISLQQVCIYCVNDHI